MGFLDIFRHPKPVADLVMDYRVVDFLNRKSKTMDDVMTCYCFGNQKFTFRDLINSLLERVETTRAKLKTLPKMETWLPETFDKPIAFVVFHLEMLDEETQVKSCPQFKVGFLLDHKQRLAILSKSQLNGRDMDYPEQIHGFVSFLFGPLWKKFGQ